MNCLKLGLSSDPYGKAWAINKEGGTDWWPLLVLLVAVGLVLLYLGDIKDGFVCMGIAGGGFLVRCWLQRHFPSSVVNADTANPRPEI